MFWHSASHHQAAYNDTKVQIYSSVCKIMQGSELKLVTIICKYSLETWYYKRTQVMFINMTEIN